jgi:tripartite-type tricarboxylate transporter receptor subunit TctC
LAFVEGTTMRIHRRTFLQTATAGLTVFSRAASARDYPTRPVHVIVGFPPGGAADIFARLMVPQLSGLGQTFLIENRPGAGGDIAASALVQAAPDGYTLLIASVANAINATLRPNPNFHFPADMTPVAGISLVPLVMAVNPSVPAKTVPEFIAYAKSNPGKLSMASPGIGTAGHVAGELFKMMAGVNMVHVPYHGGAPAMTDLLGGRVQVEFGPVPDAIGYIRAGKLRALAVTTSARSQALPDLPAVSEFVPGYEASAWWGMCAPKNTPTPIVDALNKQINAALADATIKDRFAKMGGSPMPGSAAEFGKFIAADTAKWAKVVQFAHIKPE